MTRTEAPAFDNTCAALIPLHPAPTMTASYMTPSVGLTDTGEAFELLVMMGLFDGVFDGLAVGLFDGLDVGLLVVGRKVIGRKVGAGDEEGSDVGKSSRGVAMGLFDTAFDGLDVGLLVVGLKVIRLKVGVGDVEGSDVGKNSRGGDCTGGILSSIAIGESTASVIAAES